MSAIKILKRQEVEAITGLKRSTIYKKMKSREFPLAIKLTEHSVGWIESEVLEWVNERILYSRKEK